MGTAHIKSIYRAARPNAYRRMLYHWFEKPMKKTILPLIALLLVVVFAAISQTPAAHKVVFQMNVDNTDSWNQLFANVQNVQQVFGADKIQIEVVAYGKGLSLLLKTNSAYEERMKKAIASGVVLAACQNTMRIRKVTTEDLFPFASQVDSGVSELIRKQEAGWSYIRAGE
jgi:intracellular sulfur oxidation DsrE/DsrF family protein